MPRGTLAVGGWAVTFDIARRSLGGLRLLLAVPNVTAAQPSTASLPLPIMQCIVIVFILLPFGE